MPMIKNILRNFFGSRATRMYPTGDGSGNEGPARVPGDPAWKQQFEGEPDMGGGPAKTDPEDESDSQAT
jgi:hypothetical protein